MPVSHLVAFLCVLAIASASGRKRDVVKRDVEYSQTLDIGSPANRVKKTGREAILTRVKRLEYLKEPTLLRIKRLSRTSSDEDNNSIPEKQLLRVKRLRRGTPRLHSRYIKKYRHKKRISRSHHDGISSEHHHHTHQKIRCGEPAHQSRHYKRSPLSQAALVKTKRARTWENKQRRLRSGFRQTRALMSPSPGGDAGRKKFRGDNRLNRKTREAHYHGRSKKHSCLHKDLAKRGMENS